MARRGNNEGSIYRMQDGRWRAAVTTGQDANGKPKRKVFTAATRHEVKDQLTDALKDLKLGIPIVSEKQTVAKFLEHWLEHIIKARVRPKTHRTYSDLVKLHITSGLGDVPLGKLTPQKVREFLNAKLAAGLSPRTVKHLLVTLRGALAVALKDGQIPRNVAALVDPPRVARAEVHAFNPEQARAFLEAVAGSRLEAAYTVAVAVGMRQGEILGLQWPDVDLETGALKIRAALQRVEKRLVQVEPKSLKSSRPIHLPAVCVSALVRQKAQQDEDRKWAGSRWQETGYVFTTRIGTPMDPRDLLRDYYRLTRPKVEEPKKRRKKRIASGEIRQMEASTVTGAGTSQVTKSTKRTRPDNKGELKPMPFPAIRFHDLRHSAATLLLAQGVSPRYITELLGHSQVSFTMQTYAHVLPEVQKEVATKMDEILAPKPVATTVATKPGSARPS